MAHTLKSIRAYRELSRKQVVEAVTEKGFQLTENQLYNFENFRSTPDVIVAKALADVYGCKLDDISFLRPDDTINA